MRVLSSSTVVAALLLANHVVAYTTINVGANETQLLTAALADDALYDNEVSARICFTEILRGRQRTTDNTIQYEFDILGCAVADAKAGGGKCIQDCTAVRYEVEVDQMASGALEVDYVGRDDDSDSDDIAPVSTTAVVSTVPPTANPSSSGNRVGLSAVAVFAAVLLAGAA